MSDEGIVNLARAKSLKVVDLFHAKFVTAAGVARLKKLRPDLLIYR